jgi:phosphoserine phosphatase
MDGVLFNKTQFWIELHKRLGTLKQGTALTNKYLLTDYNKLVEEVVVKLWKGMDARPYYELINSAKYMPGVKAVFDYVKANGFISAIISGSSIDLARRVQHDYGVDHIFANELVIRDGKIAGEFIWPIGAGKEKKAQIIEHLCSDLNISPKEVIYVGDAEIDLHAFQKVGFSIAFNSKSEELRKAATQVVDSSTLADILKVLPEYPAISEFDSV